MSGSREGRVANLNIFKWYVIFFEYLLSENILPVNTINNLSLYKEEIELFLAQRE